MNKKFFLVQRIDSYCCERLNINDLYLGFSYDKACDVYNKEIETFIKDQYEDLSDEEREEKIDLEIDQTKTYWEFCNDDGDNVVIMINEYEIEMPVSNI